MGAMIFACVVFAPWAFGTTQGWSIRLLTGANLLLGGVLISKRVLVHVWHRRLTSRLLIHAQRGSQFSSRRLVLWVLGGLSMLIVGFCFASALNARATYDPAQGIFNYNTASQWLPQSLDSNQSWVASWSCLGFVSFFWGLRDWLITRPLSPGDDSGRVGSKRLLLLVTVLAINGAALAAEGVIQRQIGSSRLLFLEEPRINKNPETHFGPYPYRSNAAEYLNLIWPAGLGAWWLLRRARRQGSCSHRKLLMICSMMCFSGMVATGSRAGLAVGLGMMAASSALLLPPCLRRHQEPLAPRRSGSRRARTIVLIILSGWLLISMSEGWHLLRGRIKQLHQAHLEREMLVATAKPIANDYFWFGTGPGTFPQAFLLYRASLEGYWPAQLHNDWLEIRITFGAVGFTLILGCLLCVAAIWWTPGGDVASRRFALLVMLALAGCLVHARFDFPFQIHSTLQLFITLCAALSVTGRRSLRTG